VFKPSRRALGVATAFTISAVCFVPAASASLLGGSGGGNSGLPVLSGVTDALPIAGNLPIPVGDLLGGGVGLGGLLGLGNLVGGLLGGGGLPVVGGLLGGGGGLPVVGGLLGGDLLGGGLPVVGGLLGGDSSDSAGGELLDGALSVVTDTTLACDAAIPQVLESLLLGDLTETICAPFDNGVLGLLGSL
jgi:hypothetical protein